MNIQKIQNFVSVQWLRKENTIQQFMSTFLVPARSFARQYKVLQCCFRCLSLLVPYRVSFSFILCSNLIFFCKQLFSLVCLLSFFLLLLTFFFLDPPSICSDFLIAFLKQPLNRRIAQIQAIQQSFSWMSRSLTSYDGRGPLHRRYCLNSL